MSRLDTSSFEICSSNNDDIKKVLKQEDFWEIEHQEWTIKEEEIHIKEDVDCSPDDAFYSSTNQIPSNHEGDLNEQLLCNKDGPEVSMYKCEVYPHSTKLKHFAEHSLIYKNTSEVTMYNCDDCTYETKFKYDLKLHGLSHKDGPEATEYNCDLCEFKSKYKANLNRHMLVHKDDSEVGEFNCDICSYKTLYKYHLKPHMKVHKNVRRCKNCHHECKEKVCSNCYNDKPEFECESCPYRTKNKSRLKQHILTHKSLLEVPVYRCSQCDYVSNFKTRLKHHVISHKDHSEVTTYDCKLCDYKSKYKSYLKQHESVHKRGGQVTMFLCDSCPYESKLKSNLSRHVRQRHASTVTMHLCTICSFTTKRKYCFEKHMLSHKVSEAETFLSRNEDRSAERTTRIDEEYAEKSQSNFKIMENKTCRLCLISLYNNDFDVIKEFTTQMLETLLLGVDLSISESPVMCNECAMLLQKSFDLKSSIVPGTTNEFKLKPKAQKCRFCTNEENNFVMDIKESKESIFIVNTIRNHIPELNFAEEIIACTTCLNSLRNFSYFIMSCLNIEDKIKGHINANGKNDEGHIDLNDICHLLNP